jgi:hypothetical protein
MEGRTIIYVATEGQSTDHTAYFADKIARYHQHSYRDQQFGLTTIYDQLGRTLRCYFFKNDKKWPFVPKTENQMIQQSGYQMYAASWMDTDILGYPCQAYMLREKVVFAPTYVFWVCDDPHLPRKHPHNLRYPGLPGFVMAYSWNSRRRFEATEILDTVDPYLFSDLDAEPESAEYSKKLQGFHKIMDPIAGNALLNILSNVYRLFAG